MNKENFEKLIQLITERDFKINTKDVELNFDTEYNIFRILPVTGRKVGFIWKTPKADEKMLRSFITAFTSKYREPNPAAYDYMVKIYGEKSRWSNMSDEDKEFAYCHHASNMYSKEELLKQVEANFSKENITNGLIRYGFYPTEYGIGIFCFWMTTGVNSAIAAMNKYLNAANIPFTNEFSDARWVFRFKLGISKSVHTNLLNQFN
jgi:hypothetical protein